MVVAPKRKIATGIVTARFSRTPFSADPFAEAADLVICYNSNIIVCISPGVRDYTVVVAHLTACAHDMPPQQENDMKRRWVRD